MGLTTLIVVLIVLPVLLVGLLHLWPRTPVGRRMFLAGTDEDQTVASMPVLLELEQLRGRLGRAISPLRPSGTADIDGRRVDVLTEGLMIEEGAWVRVVDVRAGKVIVRPANPPQLTDLENLEI
jgi:membrane-bound serine protease (ClpP class)